MPPTTPGANTFAYTMKVSVPPSPSDTLMVNLRAFAGRRPEPDSRAGRVQQCSVEPWPESSTPDRLTDAGSAFPGTAVRTERGLPPRL